MDTISSYDETKLPFFIALPFFVAASVIFAATSTAVLNAARELFAYQKAEDNHNRWIFVDRTSYADKLRSLVSYYFQGKLFIYFIGFCYFLLCIVKFYNRGEYMVKFAISSWFFRIFGEFIDTWAGLKVLYIYTFFFFTFNVFFCLWLISKIMRHKCKQNINPT